MMASKANSKGARYFVVPIVRSLCHRGDAMMGRKIRTVFVCPLGTLVGGRRQEMRT